MSEQKSILDHTPHRSKKRRKRTVLTLFLLLVLAAGLYYLIDRESAPEVFSLSTYDQATVERAQLVTTTEASGTVVLPRKVTIVSPSEGYVNQLSCSEGQTITTDTVLLSLETPELETELEDLSLQLQEAEITLEATISEYDTTLSQLGISLERIEEEIIEAQEEVERVKELSELRSSRVEDYEAALEALEQLEEQREDLEFSRKATESQKSFAIAKQQASIRKLERNIEQVEEEMLEALVTSPIDGEVLSLNEVLEISGNHIEKGSSLFIIADRSEVYIDLDVYEQYASLIAQGDTITVTIGTNTMSCEIVNVGRIASLDSEGLSATVTVRARPITELSLTPGASAVARLTTGVTDDALLLPRGAYLTSGSQKYVYLIEGNQAVKQAVTFGEIQGTQVQVLSGLKEGDRIITSSYANYITEDSITIE